MDNPYYTRIINGSSFLAIKVAIGTIPPLLSAGLRFSTGLILFTIFFLRRHHYYEKISREQWKHAIVIGAALFQVVKDYLHGELNTLIQE